LWGKAGDMSCHFQIVGLGSEHVRYAVGIDGLQAIISALQMVRADLEALQLELHGQLSWAAGAPGDLGL
jgi:hypothetical protein